jgi:large subunit ribosomal protein L13
VIDAENQVLGRLATQIATLLRGKHKPTYTPSMDGGDFVVVVNAEKIRITGRKAEQKLYHRHTGYPGGLRTTTYRTMLQRHPDRILRLAVKGMLPKGRLGRRQLLKLRIYAGPTHPHAAQQPKAYQPRIRG